MPASELQSIPGFTDPFSSLSHLFGAAAFIGLAPPLLRRGLRTPAQPGVPLSARVSSLATFSITAVVLLAMSTTFHTLGHGAARHVFQRLDHAAIFILIAGTSTPIHAILFRGLWRRGMLALLWTIALLGVTLKSIFFDAVPETVGVLLYLGMGWIGVASIIALWRREGFAFVWPLIAGGLAYTIGAGIEIGVTRPLVRGVIRAHEIFHLAVLAGLAFHYLFIWRAAAWNPRPHSLPDSPALPAAA